MRKTETVLVTKEEIIEALKTESLAYGQWKDDSGCAVCAVGAVIRKAFKKAQKSETARSFGCIAKRLTECAFCHDDIAPKGNYMSALSIVWEFINKHNEDSSLEENRFHIIQWAEDNIPDNYRARIRV